jgi:hypothetical protein
LFNVELVFASVALSISAVTLTAAGSVDFFVVVGIHVNCLHFIGDLE